jgi:hypothetical protein
MVVVMVSVIVVKIVIVGSMRVLAGLGCLARHTPLGRFTRAPSEAQQPAGDQGQERTGKRRKASGQHGISREI